MGLCKCPQKKVTNQFCFEHRVNVCENCMVNEHPTCVVQSYLQWLDDSDYYPVCRICDDQLATSECVRLVCYDLFHKECLNDWASRLPPNTAPAGYKCPVCSSSVFPAANLVSPIADRLKETLSIFPWARAGLDLPLIGDAKHTADTQEWTNINGDVGVENETNERTSHAPTMPAATPMKNIESVVHSTESHLRSHSQGTTNISSSNSSSITGTVSTSSVRITASEDPPITTSQFRGDVHHPSVSSVATRKTSSSDTRVLLSDSLENDADEDKYKRRSAMEWFFRWWRTMTRPSSRHHQSLIGGSKRMVALLILLAVLTLICLLSYLGRGASDDDPLLDPFNNPNIRIED